MKQLSWHDWDAIWQCVKTLYPCSSHQNSWDLWMFIPLKMVSIGIDPYPYIRIHLFEYIGIIISGSEKWVF